MRTLVESFKRLYKMNKLTAEQVIARYEKGTIITEAEMNYILEEA